VINSDLKNIKGDNSWEIIIGADRGILLWYDSQF